MNRARISVLAAVVLTTALAAHATDLTFEERVRAEEALQRVYYSHQIGVTKPFDEAVSPAFLSARVRTYLEASAALESLWGRPVTAELLSLEMARIERETRMPERLRELEAALGDDPLLIAECLARPILVDRMARAAYASDSTIVSDRAGADAAPKRRFAFTADWTGSVMIVWGGGPGGTPLSSGGMYEPISDSWTDTSRSGVPEARAFHCSAWTGNVLFVFGGNGTTPFLNNGGMFDPATNSWVLASTAGAPIGRNRCTAVWTGDRVVVWGGEASGGNTSTGALFDPITNGWTGATSTIHAPLARSQHTAVWTGSKMIVFGGLVAGAPTTTGSAYDPLTDTWAPIRKIPTRPRFAHVAVWTGTEMIVWGGASTNDGDNPGYLNTGFRYDLAASRWKKVTLDGAPEDRYYLTGVWTGTELVIWGGRNATPHATGGRYDPVTDRWTPTSTVGAPQARYSHQAVWTGTEMIVWGGSDFPSGEDFSTGGRYDPVTDTWTPTAP